MAEYPDWTETQPSVSGLAQKLAGNALNADPDETRGELWVVIGFGLSQLKGSQGEAGNVELTDDEAREELESLAECDGEDIGLPTAAGGFDWSPLLAWLASILPRFCT